MFQKVLSILFSVCACCFILFGCASSDVSRDAASNVDKGVQNAKDMVDGAMDSSIADSYENASQATKGAVLGGAAGGVAGAFTPGVGLFPGLAIGAIFGASYGSYIDANSSLEDKLKNRGANIVILGDQILIIVPSARLFNENTSNIKPQAYSTFEMLAEFINRYTKMLVKVAAYTDATGSSDIDLSLSQQQAECAAKLLAASGVDARILYAEGYGGTRLVERNNLKWDSDNYRIEITLEKLHV